jgi:hypothetical protein
MGMDTHGACRYNRSTWQAPAALREDAYLGPGQGASATMTFRTLLYRYFFFGWLFRDVNAGNVFERAAAWRHNRDQARWLPTYMRRWLWCGLVFYGLGSIAEWMLNAPGVSVLFYVPGALSVPVNAVIAAAWVGLKVLPAQC